MMEKKNKIKELLSKKGRSQRWLSKQIGVSTNTVCSWCKGTISPSIKRLSLVADVLEIDIRDLIADSELYPSMSVVQDIKNENRMWLINYFVRLLDEALKERIITPAQYREFEKYLLVKMKG